MASFQEVKKKDPVNGNTWQDGGPTQSVDEVRSACVPGIHLDVQGGFSTVSTWTSLRAASSGALTCFVSPVVNGV